MSSVVFCVLILHDLSMDVASLTCICDRLCLFVVTETAESRPRCNAVSGEKDTQGCRYKAGVCLVTGEHCYCLLFTFHTCLDDKTTYCSRLCVQTAAALQHQCDFRFDLFLVLVLVLVLPVNINN